MYRALHLFLLACACCIACARPCHVVWTEGMTDPETRKATHRMEIRNAPAGTDWTLWFCQFRTPVRLAEDAPADIVHLGGTLYRVVPLTDMHGEALVLDYEARPLVNHCRAPEGFFLQKKGHKPVRVDADYVWQPSERVETFRCQAVETSVFDMIPRLKSVVTGEGTTAADREPTVETVSGHAPGWYRITLDGNVRIEAADEEGVRYASVTLDNLRRNAAGAPVPNAVITDWPDFPYRGLMLDVSRNFTRKDDLLHLIDILAHYKASYLHLHLGDDEGWRVAIDSLPELTDYGAFRGIPELRADGTIAETQALEPSYCGTLDRFDSASSGNGFYSHADFVEILRHAWERRIRVIPEFDTPGHSRAAIKSMEVRAARTGDRRFLLSEPEDTSVYVSVQDYNDNAINVALPSTYAFIAQVFDGLIALYDEAGVPLEAIHVGGDEVPEGAWGGSPACRSLLESLGKSDVACLKDYYINRVLDIAEARGVKLAGWQEVAQHLEPATYERLKAHLAFTNLWAVSHGRDELAYSYANDGVNVVLSNAPNLYFDLAYNWDKQERGHSWSGFVDERRCFSFLPFDIYRSVRWDDKGRKTDLKEAGQGKPVLQPAGLPYLRGVQGQLWTETIRNFGHVTYYLFPKSLGLWERGWNGSPSWAGTTEADDPAFTEDFDRFFGIIKDHEYPYYESLGICYHRH